MEPSLREQAALRVCPILAIRVHAIVQREKQRRCTSDITMRTLREGAMSSALRKLLFQLWQDHYE
jgi:hypothetical protein